MTSDEQGYNGWKNYPTWNVNLWLQNDEGLYNEALERVTIAKNGAADPSDYDPNTSIRIGAADALKTWVREELMPDLGASFIADLLGFALDQVDWFAIADAWLEQAQELEGSTR